ncbi:hypothetical protein B4099_0152 [Heyndrickxia coagulans]|uniref:Uncharacterized protein n=1 Tax=Heyndrickxia coagulans TaxID=1398 RepID=A0A150JWF0_HEYCO|nr:hypothetical protein B4099_0152 [Heyndrickxia coagulans]
MIDINDVIFNFIGTMAGYGCFIVFSKIFRSIPVMKEI